MSINKQSIPTALPGRTHLDLSCDHVTTMDFGIFQPVHYRHPIKGEHLNLSGIGTVRPFPLACPTFGRLRCNVHHFYVPWRVVFPQYDSFYNDTIAVNAENSSLIDSAPYILNSDISGAFTSSDLNPYATEIHDDSVVEDFIDFDGNRYRFTSLGKFCYKILESLGYEINFNKNDNVQLSALPLLAYAKIFIDYYANQSYLDSQDVISIKKLLAYNDPVTPLHVNAFDLGLIFNLIRYCQYEQDYFVGAWDNPFAPNSQQYSAITFNDVVSGASISNLIQNEDGSAGTPVMISGASSPFDQASVIGTQYLHDALKAITDYSKRHQLAGATNINRTLAQYGLGVNAMKIDRSIHLQGSSFDIETGAVFSTANTAQAGQVSTLGDYAGNGFGKGVSDFDFKVEELGIQITIASILPSGGYFQGCDENNMHVHRFDFFTPEFDQLSTQILRKREVYVSRDGRYGTVNDTVEYDKAFGHVGRYGEYKRSRNWVSGDFRCPSRFLGGDAWHLMRQFNDYSFTNKIIGQNHSLEFTRYLDSASYRRIFAFSGYSKDFDNDPFYAEFHWAVGSYAPCHGLFDNYEFETEGNKKVTLESNGAVLN